MRYIKQGVFKDGHGNVVPSGTISVYLAGEGTTTAASIYTAETGGTAVNSVTTGSDGVFTFWVDTVDYAFIQRFKIVLSKTNYISQTYNYEIIFKSVHEHEVDVRKFGTLGAGTDAAIINLALASGGIIRCPLAQYTIETAIIMPSGSTLRGDAGTVFNRPDSTNYTNNAMIQNTNYLSDTPGADNNIEVEGISIVGNKANNATSMTGIYLRSVQHFKIDRNYVEAVGHTPADGNGTGIVVSNCQYGEIKFNWVHNCGGDGIDAYSLNDEVVISHNKTTYNCIAGIEIEGRIGTNYTDFRNNGITVVDNVVTYTGSGHSNYGHGILSIFNDNCKIQNNVVANNDVWVGAITLIGDNGTDVSGNIVHDNTNVSATDPGGYGIGIWAHYVAFGADGINKNVSVHDNIVDDNAKGIFVRDAQELKIVHNTVQKTSALHDGIIVEQGTAGENVEIAGNTVNVHTGSACIGIKDDYNGVNIHDNTLKTGLYGVVLYSTASPSTMTNIRIKENTFDTVTNGIFAVDDITLTDGDISANIYKDVTNAFGGAGGTVTLSSSTLVNEAHLGGAAIGGVWSSVKTIASTWAGFGATYQVPLAIGTLADSATPAVTLASAVWLTGGTTTITDITGGVTGQEITIIAEHSLTITDGTNIFLSGSANFVMAATDTLTLLCKADGNWYEKSRSDNT